MTRDGQEIGPEDADRPLASTRWADSSATPDDELLPPFVPGRGPTAPEPAAQEHRAPEPAEPPAQEWAPDAAEETAHEWAPDAAEETAHEWAPDAVEETAHERAPDAAEESTPEAEPAPGWGEEPTEWAVLDPSLLEPADGADVTDRDEAVSDTGETVIDAGEAVQEGGREEPFPFDGPSAWDEPFPFEPDVSEGPAEAPGSPTDAPPAPAWSGAGAVSESTVTEMADRLEALAARIRAEGAHAARAGMASDDRLSALLATLVAGYLEGREG